jgi:acylglycerol lipase
LHGFGEHTGRYLEFFEKFAQNGIKVISFDQRGHGQTGKIINKIGVGSNTKILFKDVDELIEKYRDATANLVLMGHSYVSLDIPIDVLIIKLSYRVD